MKNKYIEKEWKVLEVNLDELSETLDKLGAKKVFDDYRIVTSFENADRTMVKSGKHLKVTEEGSVKVSLSQVLDKGVKEEVKFKASRVEEVTDFLIRLGYVPIARSKSRRISYEWDGIDFDIDIFPEIPAFLEIDLGDSDLTLESVLDLLKLKDRKTVIVSTPEIYQNYGKNYFELFKL